MFRATLASMRQRAELQREGRWAVLGTSIDARVARNIIRKIRMMNAAAATLKANNKSRAG